MFGTNFKIQASNLLKIIRQLHKSHKTYKSVQLSYTSYENTKTPTESATTNTGPPPPLIVKHGLFGSKTNWNSLCKVFHQQTIPQRKIIAVDARNHGESPHSDEHTYEHLALDIKELCEQLDIRRTALLGHSMGGRAVMLFALKYPEMVEKLIVADVSPVQTNRNPDGISPLFEALNNVQFPVKNSVSLALARNSIDKQLSQAVPDRVLRSFLLTNLVQKDDGSFGWRINIPALLSNYKHIIDFPEIKQTFNGPVLFLAGGNSNFVQKEDHPKILKLFPNAEFHYIEGAGHWLHSEKPTEFLKYSIEFLNR